MSTTVQHIELFIEQCLTALPVPERLRDAMNYSLLAKGKRLRPMLCLLSAAVCTPEAERTSMIEKAVPFAAGLEMIHTYSLIHDDLPAMDDDDLRRGRPSNHKAFDEATAILAGDALLTDAFAFMASVGLGEQGLPAPQVLRAVAEVAVAAGGRGMVGGQMLDMALTGQQLAAEAPLRAEQLHAVRQMNDLKTGALFRAACIGGGLLAGANDVQLDALRRYATHFGVAFQIIDDILDVTSDTATLGKPVGSDVELGKLTWPALAGLEQSREQAARMVDEALAALKIFHGAEAETLQAILHAQLKRIAKEHI